MILSKKAFIILLFLANLTTTNTMEIETWRLESAQRRMQTILNHIKPANSDLRGEIMNNTTHSTFYAFLAAIAIATGTAEAMEDFSLSAITTKLPITHQTKPKSNVTITTPSTSTFQVITNDYEDNFVRLQNSINKKDNPSEIVGLLNKLYISTEDSNKKATILNIVLALDRSIVDEAGIANLQKNLISIKPTKIEQPTFHLPELFNSWNEQTAKRYQAQKDLQLFETLFESVNNQLNTFRLNIQNNSSTDRLINTLNQIKKLLPKTSTRRKGKIDTIIKIFSNNEQILTDNLFNQCNRLISEIILLSISSNSPNQIIEKSYIQEPDLIKKGLLCPSPIDTNGFTNFIIAKNDISNSLKIYLLQLMWWKEMSDINNKLKKNNSANAACISKALRAIASKKNYSCDIIYLHDAYNKNQQEQIKHINNDSFSEESEYYNAAILPSIIHNVDTAPAPRFHDQETNNRALNKLLEKEDLHEDFKTLLTTLKDISERPTPDYNKSQINRRPERVPNTLQELIDQGKHFPLLEESLNNPNLPESFKLLLKKYLNRNNQTEEEQSRSNTEQLIAHLQKRRDFLENYIINISTHPIKHEYLPNTTLSADTYNTAIHEIVQRLLGLVNENNELIDLNDEQKQLIDTYIKTQHESLQEKITQEIAKIDARIAKLTQHCELINSIDDTKEEKKDSDVSLEQKSESMLNEPVMPTEESNFNNLDVLNELRARSGQSTFSTITPTSNNLPEQVVETDQTIIRENQQTQVTTNREFNNPQELSDLSSNGDGDDSLHNSKEKIQNSLTQNSPDQSRPTNDINVDTINKKPDTTLIESENKDHGAEIERLSEQPSRSSSMSDAPKQLPTDSNNGNFVQQKINANCTTDKKDFASEKKSSDEPQKENINIFVAAWNYVTNTTLITAITNLWYSFWNLFGL